MKIPAELEGRTTIPLWPDAATILGATRYSIYEAAKAGTIPVLHLGARRMVVPVAKLCELLGYSDREVHAAPRPDPTGETAIRNIMAVSR